MVAIDSILDRSDNCHGPDTYGQRSCHEGSDESGIVGVARPVAKPYAKGNEFSLNIKQLSYDGPNQ